MNFKGHWCPFYTPWLCLLQPYLDVHTGTSMLQQRCQSTDSILCAECQYRQKAHRGKWSKCFTTGIFKDLLHSHVSVRLNYRKGNGALAEVKNQGRKFPFRYVLCLANILKKAGSESDCLERMKIVLPNSQLFIVKIWYEGMIKQFSIGTLSFTQTRIRVLTYINNDRDDVDLSPFSAPKNMLVCLQQTCKDNWIVLSPG